MEDGCDITQRRFGVTMAFRFGAEKLTRAMSDYSGSHSFSIPYEQIDVDNPFEMNVNAARPYRRVATLAGVVAIVMLANRAGPQVLLASKAVLVLVALYLIANWLKLFMIRYTMLPVLNASHPQARVRIIRDGRHHDAIFDEIRSRRRDRLRALYATPDFSADPTQELARFDHLLQAGIVSEAEHAAVAERFRALAAAASPAREAPQSLQ